MYSCVCIPTEVMVPTRMEVGCETRFNEHSSGFLSHAAEDVTDVDLHTPPASHSLMRLSKSAERDSH